MKRLLRSWAALVLAVLFLLGTAACAGGETISGGPDDSSQSESLPADESIASGSASSGLDPGGEDASSDGALPDPDGVYTTKEDVSLYLDTYGELPSNFITKKEAKELGWAGGSLEPYAPGMCIGGDRFGNYEGLLPEDRTYHECDINTLGADSRGAERLVFSEDGLIYYTGDHYESFTLLYGEE